MGRIYAVDSYVLIEGLANRDGDLYHRLRDFGRYLEQSHSILMLPTPVLAEYLQGPPSKHGSWNLIRARHDVRHLLQASRVADVTELAAFRCAEMARGQSGMEARIAMERALRDKGASSRAARQMVKMDWLIMATCEAAGVTTIFTNEGEAEKWSRFVAGTLKKLSVEPWTKMPRPAPSETEPAPELESPKPTQTDLFPSSD